MGFVSTTYRLVQALESNERTKIINVIVMKRENMLFAYIFPRWRRLPDNFIQHFKDPDKTIKPGSSEMAGLIITVDRDVFEFATLENVWTALDSVSSTHEDLEFIYRDINSYLDDSKEEFNLSFPELENTLDRMWHRGLVNGFVRETCLQDIERKSYYGGLIEVQFNPHRKSIVSKARVERRKRGEEDCPYCIEEPGREDVPWNGYILSVNPYPYYDHHLVIVNARHVYQYIDEPALRIMAEFVLNAPRYFTVYNGPPGTSILAHMHFQGGIYTFPVEDAKKEILGEKGKVKVFKILDFPTRGIVVVKKMGN